MPLDGFPNGYNVAMAALATAWEPSEILSLWQWADKKVYLPRGTSPKVGEFRTDRVPMSREIMEVLSPHHPSKKVVAMMSSQLCKTQIGLNFIGYHIEHDPQTILVVYPTVDLAEDWSTDKFTPIAMASSHIKAAMSVAKSRDGSNTILKKSFLGGSLKIAGANTPSSLSSRGGAILYCDEVDRYPQSAGIEGDPITIAERALIAYQDQAKEYLSSTPTIKSLSRINKEFQLSDRRYYHVPCPHCDELQVLAWDNFKWDAGQPHTAHFVCPHNGCVIEEHDKVTMLPDAHMGGKAQWISTNPESKIPGFHAWAAYASLGMGMSWHTLAEKWEECGRDPEKEKAYINIYRGECFDDPTEKLDWEVIKSRATPYKLRTIPAGCLILTGAVDVQGNRIELQILGWGRGGKVWVIDYVALPGDPTQPHVWEALDKLLQTPIINRFGVAMRVRSCGVDSGYLTDEVLKFARMREHRGVFALHGSKIQGRQAISTATAQDRNARGKQKSNGVKSWLIGSDTLKHTLFLWLQEDGKDGMDETNRRIHFSNELPDEYFTQLCAEIYDPHKKRWVKQQSRNEALDTFIYNIAGARHPKLRLHLFRESDWAKFEAVIEPPTGDLFHVEHSDAAQQDITTPRQAVGSAAAPGLEAKLNTVLPSASRPKGNFATNWKR
jgi:phage terminase large subunit GpA-like protein